MTKYECGVCEQPIEGVVYFASNYYSRPMCGECARLGKWGQLVEWYKQFRPDEEPPAQDADLPTLELPPAQECEVCGREVAWLGWRRSRLVVCSYACEHERENAKRRVVPEPRPCEVCGDEFTPKRSDAKTCSDRCRQRLRRSQITARAAARADNRDSTPKLSPAQQRLLRHAAENTRQLKDGSYEARQVGGHHGAIMRTLGALVDRGLMRYTCTSQAWGVLTDEGLEVSARLTDKGAE